MNSIKDYSSIALRVSLLLIVCQLTLALIYWRDLPPEIPFFYSKPWGEEQLGGAYWLFVLPGFSLTVTAGNFFASKLVGKKPENKTGLAAQILVFFTPIFSFLCLFTIARIIFLVA